MGNIITFALLGIFLSPVVPNIETEKKVNLSVHPDSVLCNCVEYTRQYRPDLPSMDAGAFVVSTTTPSVGAVAKMFYPRSGLYHLAVVEEVGDGWITIRDANYTPCKETVRKIWLPDRVLGYL